MGEREADFVNMVLWGRPAETLAATQPKGSLISVDGELRTRRFEKKWRDELRDRSTCYWIPTLGKSCSTCHA